MRTGATVVVAVIAVTVLAGCGGASRRTLGVPQTNVGEGDRLPERRVEIAVEYPAPPARDKLIPFRVSAAAEVSHLVDPASISVATDGTVRATVVERYPFAHDSVRYEGFRCATRERRTFGYGRPEGAWIDARPSEWRRLSSFISADASSVLYRDFFCPNGKPIATVNEGINALVRGGHPSLTTQ
ncbi:MAG: CNP1-like family protein [Burkholderiales bacterium]